jgi:hypothetical protein
MSEPTDVPSSGDVVPPLSQAYVAPSMPDITDLVGGSKGRAEPPRSGGLGRGVIIGGVVGALVIAGGAFVAGRATASGPATLAAAVEAAQAGSLPCGTPSGATAFFISRLCGGTQGGGQGGAGQNGQPGQGVPGQGVPGQGGPGGFGRGVVGQVTAVSATSLTVNTRAGSVTVAVPSTVAVSKTVAGSIADVAVGTDVTVASTSDAAGNRTATSITIVPAGQLQGGDGGLPPLPGASG